MSKSSHILHFLHETITVCITMKKAATIIATNERSNTDAVTLARAKLINTGWSYLIYDLHVSSRTFCRCIICLWASPYHLLLAFYLLSHLPFSGYSWSTCPALLHCTVLARRETITNAFFIYTVLHSNYMSMSQNTLHIII